MNTLTSISESKEEGKRELSLEEIKALRLCKCGNYKHGIHDHCTSCHLLFSGNGMQTEFLSELQRVKNGEIEYPELFRFLENDIPSRRAVMLNLLMRQRIMVSKEDFVFFRKNIERRRFRRDNFIVAPERGMIRDELNKAVPVYGGHNTV